MTAAGLLPDDAQWVQPGKLVDEDREGDVVLFDGREPDRFIVAKWCITNAPSSSIISVIIVGLRKTDMLRKPRPCCIVVAVAS